MKRSKELLIAAAAFFCLLLAAHHYIFKGQVDSIGSPWEPRYEAIQHILEMSYQLIPGQWTMARLIKSGQLPSWMPYTEGGTPLIGKMQIGVFSPFHLVYYLSPESWMPWAFTLSILLSQLAAFFCFYVFARLAGLRLIFAIAACGSIVLAPWGGHLSSLPISNLFFPVLLTLAELYRRGSKRSLALWLVPPTVALAFFAGHFETAARMIVMADVYFLLRAFDPGWSSADRTRHCLRFAAAQAVGAVWALAQIVPAMEYSRWSYNNVWRTRLEYGWIYSTINKHLMLEDLPMLLIGLLSLGLSVWLLKKLFRETAPKNLGKYSFGASVALAVAVAALAQLGLDDTGYHIFNPGMSNFGICQYPVVFLWLAALYAAFLIELPPSLKALRPLLVIGSLIRFMAPPVSNLLASLPVTKVFNNTATAPELWLALCFLGAAALQQGQAEAFGKRLAALKRFALCLMVVAGGWLASGLIKPPLCRLVATGAYPGANPAPRQDAFMGPEKLSAWTGTRQPLRGWSGSPCASAAVFGVSDSGQIVSTAASEILPGLDGCSFYGLLPVPAQPTELQIVARLTLPNGSAKTIRGARLTSRRVPWRPLIGAAAAFSTAILAPWSGPCFYLAAAALWDANMSQPGVEPKDFPFRLPSMERLRSERSLFRVSSFRYSFLQADYANLYGLSDIRNGGDNMDVLPVIYFNFLASSLLAKPDGSPEQTLALRLLGLANVAYLMDVPAARHVSPQLEEYYRGEDMVIYRNKLAMPRAVFFDRAVELPILDITEWDQGRQLAYAALPQLLQQPGFDPQKTLILNDPPQAEPPTGFAASSPSSAASVEVVSYQPNRVTIKVDASRAGYVFLGDNDFPGWRALVNGKPAHILRALLTFRAVAVPAGRSEIEFAYEPFTLFFGFFTTCLISILWLGLFFWRGPRMGLEAEAQQPAPKARGKTIPAAPADQALELWAARWARGLLVGAVGAASLYWTAWTAFVYRGGIQAAARRPPDVSTAAQTAACLVLLAALAEAIVVLRRHRRQSV